MNLILLGYPGSGKGTQAKTLAAQLNLFHVSTGDIFREEVAKKTPLGVEFASYLSAGKLVPDRLVMDVLKSRLGSETKGLLFDGFPRTVEQAEGLDAWLQSRGQEIDAVVFLDVPEADVVRRLGDRRTCSGCGRIYNIGTLPPAQPGVCDACGKNLVTRDDDQPAVIAKRLQVYRDQTEPLISYYKAGGSFHKVPAAGAPDEVASRIAELLRGK